MAGEMLAARGIVVGHWTVRQRGPNFGQAFADAVRRQLPRPGDKWHLGGVVVSIAGRKHRLWRGADRHGVVPGIPAQSRRDTATAKRLKRKLPKRQGLVARVMVTAELGSHGGAKRAIMPGAEHRQHEGLNNRAGNSHLWIGSEQ